MALVEHDDEIEAFAANRADDALGEGILPRRASGDDDLTNAHALDAALEVSAEDGIAIAEQVSGAGLVRERVDDLSSRPRGGGLVGDADVEEFSSIVAEYHESEEQAKRQGRYDEEVDGRDVVTVSSQKDSPRRRRATGGSPHVLGDGEGGDFIAEEAEFGLDPAPAPDRVLSTMRRISVRISRSIGGRPGEAAFTASRRLSASLWTRQGHGSTDPAGATSSSIFAAQWPSTHLRMVTGFRIGEVTVVAVAQGVSVAAVAAGA